MAEKKKLIEVALPLEAINAASAREKSIRHGHPSTLHLWWARRPLAAARAVIWSSLVDDPSSHPEQFPTEEDQERERQRLFRILEDLVVWENLNNEKVLNAAKAEIMKSTDGNPPALLDPFSGGGAIPLEAQRLGLESHACDLNPVAVTIDKASIEIPSRFCGKPPANPESRSKRVIASWVGNSGLVEDVSYYAAKLKKLAWTKLKPQYPKVTIPKSLGGGNAIVVAWDWTRVIKCPNPACGYELPLIRVLDLCKKKGAESHIKIVYDEGELRFEIHAGRSKQPGTVNRKGAICPNCGQPVSFSYIREEGNKGHLGQKLMAVIAEGDKQKIYLSPSQEQTDAADVAMPDCDLGEFAHYPGYVNPPAYGLKTIQSVFTNRQLDSLITFSDLLSSVCQQAEKDAIEAGYAPDGISLAENGVGAKAYSEAIKVYLAFIIDRLADRNSALCGWDTSREGLSHTFSMSGMGMTWDFAEANPFSNSSGCFDNMVMWVTKSLGNMPTSGKGEACQCDAQSDYGLRNIMVSTDPPYYSNVPYADFSDFFYVWMKRNLRDVYPKLFSTMMTPKQEELVADPFRENRGKRGARDFFENGMFSTFKQVREYLCDDIPLTVYYAFKQSDTALADKQGSAASTGWETMLTAIINAGFAIVGTWPIRTELANRSRGNSSNALASSIVLVCRKRPKESPICTRRDFVNVLRRELKPALRHLQESNIAPVDLAQSAIGPGMGVYSRYSKVIEADGSVMDVRSALQIINQELDLYFTEQEGDLDRESRFCVELYTQYAFNYMKFGDADILARAKNTSVAKMADDGALYAQHGIVHLATREELSDKKSASSMLWAFTQRLVRAMETGGVESCAQMLQGSFGASRGERAKSLAYRLFTIADKKGWAQEAYAYNNLVIAWPEITMRAADIHRTAPVQTSMFDTTSD